LILFENAVKRLEEVLENPLDEKDIVVDATIQRFEFTFELFWKTLKRFLYLEGIETKSPRETLKKAYQSGWLKDEEFWLKMLHDRNLTSHIYDKEQALEIYERIKGYCSKIKETYLMLSQKLLE